MIKEKNHPVDPTTRLSDKSRKMRKMGAIMASDRIYGEEEL